MLRFSSYTLVREYPPCDPFGPGPGIDLLVRIISFSAFLTARTSLLLTRSGWLLAEFQGIWAILVILLGLGLIHTALLAANRNRTSRSGQVGAKGLWCRDIASAVKHMSPLFVDQSIGKIALTRS